MRSRWLIGTSLAASFALFSCAGIYAQERQERQDQRQEERHEHHWDNQHPRFDDHERQEVRVWWDHHRDRPEIGFRDEDRLPRDWDDRLRVGFTFDNDWRERLHPVPEELREQLPPPPPGYRYYVVGRHIVLLDRDWRVADVININF